MLWPMQSRCLSLLPHDAKQGEEADMTEMEEPGQEDVAEKKRTSPFFRFRAIAGAIGRTAASAGSMLADPELRG